jgi:hypothetical protein
MLTVLASIVSRWCEMPFTGNYTCDSFKQGLFDGTFDFGSGTTDVYKIALYTNAASLDAQTTSYTATNEASGGSYVAGGATITPALASLSGAAYVDFSNASWTGAITARCALIYNSSKGNKSVAVLDFGSDKTSTTTFTITMPVNGPTTSLIRSSN